ncbi:MAG: bifunctional (p)ppGpp synthetase/guanosine-3',5'-bis(diphosphate) 3'-pyrophosphohydrolase [Elusimicrobia bacterium]|nr:bifunctional (p)ppGpp synthetase/guanosine-3',5'-bis(diphosphate) 3'-pyrophosphohydrolase [Elusimicrobiota bacterium]
MDFKELVNKFKEYSNTDTTLLELAYDFAKKAHGEQKRASGEMYFVHVYEVAVILCNLRMDINTVCAGLLHDVLEDTQVTPDILKKEFGDEICNLVDGVTKIDGLHFSSKDEEQAQNWRKMIIATAKDVRVIIIKLADRLHNMRTLEYLSNEKQKDIAYETLTLYAPIAHRLGIFNIKNELEDLSFKYLYPEDYKKLKLQVDNSYAKREEILKVFSDKIHDILKKSGVEYRILYRAKNLYSIYRKMQNQNKPFEEIQDTLGIRIITDTVLNCYAILGVIHSNFKPLSGSFTDYIAMPKSNLYQSLHTTVLSPGGEPIEIQIRTEDMHRISEYGIAAHWRYKHGNVVDGQLNDKLNWARQWIEWMNDIESPHEFMEMFKTELDVEEIFVFTPKGDVKALPKGSTPVDFAYSIHTDIGEHCFAARVNSKIEKLDYELKSGDVCEIITRKNMTPNKDWLNFVKSQRARSKIKKYLREHGNTDI